MTKRPEMLGPWAIVHWPRGANKRKPCTLTSGQGTDCSLLAAICHLPTRWRCAPAAEAAAPPLGTPSIAWSSQANSLGFGDAGYRMWGFQGLRTCGCGGYVGVQASGMRDVGFGDSVI